MTSKDERLVWVDTGRPNQPAIVLTATTAGLARHAPVAQPIKIAKGPPGFQYKGVFDLATIAWTPHL
jgi:hypothetical protein